MKKLQGLLIAIALITIGNSCRHHGNTDLSYSEDEHSYSLDAWFPENKTRDVEEYINHKIGSKSNMSFNNTKIDGDLVLDDHTTFYMQKSPGRLEIQLDKDKNAEESYLEIKSMCEGIKKVLAE